MAEVTFTGKDHGDATFIGRCDHFFVANRSARLDNSGCTSIDDDIQTVSEREEGVRGGNAALQGETGLFGLNRSDTSRIHPAHLTGADT